MRIAGIDPGQRGAVAVFQDDNLEALYGIESWTSEDGLDPKRMAESLALMHLDVAWLERVGPRPTDGAVAAFSFGYNFATIRAALLFAGVKTCLIPPAAWIDACGMRGTSKAQRMAQCKRSWPGRFEKRMRTDYADAALIGSYGVARELFNG